VKEKFGDVASQEFLGIKYAFSLYYAILALVAGDLPGMLTQGVPGGPPGPLGLAMA
jgi:hypothetical protein